jgi:hypothetical protein
MSAFAYDGQTHRRRIAQLFRKINCNGLRLAVLLVLPSLWSLTPMIEHLSYNNVLSLAVKVLIACLFKPIDGIYESILWNRTIKKVV